MKYPVAKIKPTPVTFGRVSYSDSYQWLEEDSAESVELEAAQSQLTRQWFDNNPARAHAVGLIDAIPRIENNDFPVFSGGRWFRRHTPHDQKMPLVEVADAIDGAWRVVIDLNKMSTGELLTIDTFVPSLDGRKLAIGMGIDGRECAELRVIDVDSGEWLLAPVLPLRPIFVAWLPDSSGFYFSAIEPSMTTADMKVFRQMLGAELVGEPERYEITHSLTWAKVAADGKHTLLIADHLNPRPDFIRDETSGGDWRPFLKGETSLFRGDILGEHFYAVTNEGAPCGRVVSIPLATPTDRSTWKELVPGSSDVLGTLHVVDGHLVLADLVNCYSRLRVFDVQGKLKGEIEMPGHGAMSAINFVVPNMIDMFCKGEGGDVIFPFSTAAQSPALYKANIHSLKVETLTQPLLKLDAQFHDHAAISADGARVPYNVIARADVDLSKPQPTAIYAYGGFAVALVPSWSGSWLAAWIQAGGVLVLGHLRGGGELGPDMWHQGRQKTKQNTFNDVYAIAEDLIARGITTASKLGVVGGSNGGTMAITVTVQRPDLFRANIAQAPTSDMLAMMRDPIAKSIALLDYGDAYDPEMSEVIAAWSPYQNVKDGTAYPALFMDAGKCDVRCPPWHVRKMAARLQAANTNSNPILMLVREGVGHGPANYESTVTHGRDWLTFFVDQLGLAPDAD